VFSYFLKHQHIKENMQELKRKNEEHKDLSWFTLPQGLRPIFCQLVKISTKKSQDQLTTLAPSKLSLLPAVHTAPCSTHCSPQYTLLPAALTP